MTGLYNTAEEINEAFEKRERLADWRLRTLNILEWGDFSEKGEMYWKANIEWHVERGLGDYVTSEFHEMAAASKQS